MTSLRSKIPVRVEAKPKILTDAESKRTSTVIKKKPSTNPLDRRKKSTKEVTRKEVKPVNLQIKDKVKENRFQPSSKALRNKEHNNKAPKTSAENKWIKNSNPVSQVLKNRNKLTATEAPLNRKPVEDKDSPFSSFKKKIPEINFSDDDPFKDSAEEEKVKNSNHPLQQDIEFVADERMKNYILSNREFSPGILKSCPNFKMSSVMNRPSLYKGLKLPSDPFKQALADIINYDLAAEGRRISEMQRNGVYPSPPQHRNSLIIPLKYVGNPFQEAMKSLAKLRIHPKVKSCKKKVTFSLPGENRSSEVENNAENCVDVIQPRLTRLTEKICEDSNSSTPEFEGNILTPYSNPPKKVTGDSPLKSETAFVNRQINYLCRPEKTDAQEDDFLINKASISTSSSCKTVENNEKVVHDLSLFSFQSKNSSKDSTIFSKETQNSTDNTLNPFLNMQKTSEVRPGLFSNKSEHFLDKMNKKICTPQPVSFYKQTKLPESFSPEFLSDRTTDILSWAPINTPSVLKALGKYELSPVCKKLKFKDSPKETNEENSRENSQTFYLQNIMTRQKILDQLADQECSIFMQDSTFPCEARNYLQNPIAQILNDGDESHFVHVSLRRLS